MILVIMVIFLRVECEFVFEVVVTLVSNFFACLLESVGVFSVLMVVSQL